MGHPILHDPQALIGHRFQASFNRYTVRWEHIYVNQLRMIRKSCTDPVWRQWIEKFKERNSEADWDNIWNLFSQNLQSADQERDYLFSERTHDEFWYAERFGLNWPNHSSKTYS